MYVCMYVGTDKYVYIYSLLLFFKLKLSCVDILNDLKINHPRFWVHPVKTKGVLFKPAAKERGGSMVLNSKGTSWPLRWKDEPWVLVLPLATAWHTPNRIVDKAQQIFHAPLKDQSTRMLLICRLLVWLGVLRKQAGQLQSALVQQSWRNATTVYPSLFFSWIVDFFFVMAA